MKTNNIWERIKQVSRDKDNGKPGADAELQRLIEKLRKQNISNTR